MRKYLYLLISLLGIAGCSTDEIDLYNAPDYLSFVNREADTVEISFLLLGNLMEYDCPVPVRLTGMPLGEDTEFTIAVDEKRSTAGTKYYELPDTRFAKGQTLDTFYVTLKNFPELTSSNVKLCLELKANGRFELGDRDYRRIYFSINDNVARPEWWNSTVETTYLGTYSDKKFRKLITVVKPDLSDVSDDLIRGWALQLKYELMRLPDMEEDGSLMTVTVR